MLLNGQVYIYVETWSKPNYYNDTNIPIYGITIQILDPNKNFEPSKTFENTNHHLKKISLNGKDYIHVKCNNNIHQLLDPNKNFEPSKTFYNTDYLERISLNGKDYIHVKKRRKLDNHNNTHQLLDPNNNFKPIKTFYNTTDYLEKSSIDGTDYVITHQCTDHVVRNTIIAIEPSVLLFKILLLKLRELLKTNTATELHPDWFTLYKKLAPLLQKKFAPCITTNNLTQDEEEEIPPPPTSMEMEGE
jgi:hypothetical protein